MKFNMKLKKKTDAQEGTTTNELNDESLIGVLDIKRHGAPEGYTDVETYPLNAPFSYASIVQNENTSEYLYIIDEVPLGKEEKEAYELMKNVLEYELKAPLPEEGITESFHRQFPAIAEEHPKALQGISAVGARKIQHYLEREIIGYGKIDPMMYDQNVEDIGCSGVEKRIFLWHRKYENIRTNIFYSSEEELNDFVMKIVHKSGKHVSIAFPIVDVTLPGKHRLAVSYGRETTPSGTSFTIRKFRKDPFTIIDLIENETINESIAAYLWLLVENKMPIMIIGATGAGKTTALNAIACLIQPSYKIISVEEVAEINLPHENWTSNIARSGFGTQSEGEITLYDLIKSAVRHRPDLIIVGEVRGEEAYVLFQALATGHGGLCTMHADDVDTAVKRLTQPPMNIPSSIIPMMNSVIVVRRVRTPIFLESGKRLSSRKFVRVSEIKDPSTLMDVFSWNASSDSFQESIADSVMMKKIATRLDISLERLLSEFEYRKHVLLDMVEHNIRDYRNVNRVLSKYYNSLNFRRSRDTTGRFEW
jgi:flagellar protein FlaI